MNTIDNPVSPLDIGDQFVSIPNIEIDLDFGLDLDLDLVLDPVLDLVLDLDPDLDLDLDPDLDLDLVLETTTNPDPVLALDLDLELETACVVDTVVGGNPQETLTIDEAQESLSVVEVEFLVERPKDTVYDSVIEGPCFIVDNVMFETQLSYISDDYGLPVYFYADGVYTAIGTLAPTLDNIRRLKYLEFGIQFKNTQGDILDLYAPEVLYKFVSLV